jgi:hypothetical protein
MDPIWKAAPVWLKLVMVASVGCIMMLEKQLLQPSNAGNVLCFACYVSKIDKQKNQKSKQAKISLRVS